MSEHGTCGHAPRDGRRCVVNLTGACPAIPGSAPGTPTP